MSGKINNMDKDNFGKKMSEILVDIETGIWERDYMELGPTGYTMDGFRSGIKIFMSTLMDKMWNLQEKSKLTMEERNKLALNAGKDIRKLVLKYTGIDSHDLYKDAMDKEKK